MPNIKSAMKRVKVSKTKNLRNRMVKTGVKTAVKKYQIALTEGVAPASEVSDRPDRGCGPRQRAAERHHLRY